MPEHDDDQTMTTDLPPNPFYKRQYSSTVRGGTAHCEIPAPGGKVLPQDAQDLLDWLGLISRQLERDAQPTLEEKAMLPEQSDPLIGILQEIGNEVVRAESLHAPLHSHHEAYAVIWEELEEYWREVRKRSERRDPAAMRKELIHTAAVCVRTLGDVVDSVPLRGGQPAGQPYPESGEPQAVMTHGMNCSKAEHHEGETGYLHGPDDNSPYDVDGVIYCGRCHVALD